MTVDPNFIDLPAFMAEHLHRAEPRPAPIDVVHVRAGADVGRGVRDLWCPLRLTVPRADQLPQRLPDPGLRHPHRHHEVAIPKLREGSYFPDWLLERRRRSSDPDHGGRDLLSARSLDPADGEARRDPGDHAAVQVAGLGDGQGARCPCRGLPHPAAGPERGPDTRRTHCLECNHRITRWSLHPP